MVCAIMQPTYFPWSGYFDLIDQADKFVFLDDVQLVKRSWMVRNRIKTQQGPLFLTIPVRKTKHRDDLLIHETEIDDSRNWVRKHLNSIHQAYHKTVYFESIYGFIEDLLLGHADTLADFNINTIQEIAIKLKIDSDFIRSSALSTADLYQADKLLRICELLGCTTYLSSQGSAAYLEQDIPGSVFGKSQVELYYLNYEHPVYPQLYGDFISHMCIIDLLFNVGFDQAPEIIRSGRKSSFHYTEFRKKIMNM
ncbi:MAG: WbqC family protein [Cyclobacteriaceae bacterium]|nr:WbqC family protein [Cyclobacteriaceae bacterium]